MELFWNLARKSADEMKTTARVGDAEEDATMAEIRSALSRINALGMVTTDSQMGAKSRYTFASNSELEGETWQRAYVCGIMLRDHAAELVEKLDLEDDIIASALPYMPEERYRKRRKSDADVVNYLWKHVSRICVTRELHEDGTFRPHTRIPGFAPALSHDMAGLLPETGLLGDEDLERALAPHVVAVHVVDTRWGRKDSLFDRVAAALEGYSRQIPSLSQPSATQAGGFARWPRAPKHSNSLALRPAVPRGPKIDIPPISTKTARVGDYEYVPHWDQDLRDWEYGWVKTDKPSESERVDRGEEPAGTSSSEAIAVGARHAAAKFMNPELYTTSRRTEPASPPPVVPRTWYDEPSTPAALSMVEETSRLSDPVLYKYLRKNAPGVPERKTKPTTRISAPALSVKPSKSTTKPPFKSDEEVSGFGMSTLTKNMVRGDISNPQFVNRLKQL